MLILDKDNIEEIVDDNLTVIGVYNSSRTRYGDKEKVEKVINDLSFIFSDITFIIMDSDKNPISTKRIAPEGIEYFPLFYVIKEGEVEDIYFGVGVENLSKIIDNHL